ncbi:response regulator [Aliifodinibius sp. S!AR15-10]|nr:response regulator [Aliifodinibius sp. S!AR15-10]
MDNAIEILIVEDNPNDAELTIRTLEKNNLSNRILWLEDGEQALDFLKGRGDYEGRNTKHKPKVIFLDLKLPKMSGIEVVQKIRQEPNLEQIPVVMMTSSQEQKDRLQGYQNGVNSYIVKPLDFPEFTEAINDVGYYWLVLNRPPND